MHVSPEGRADSLVSGAISYLDHANHSPTTRILYALDMDTQGFDAQRRERPHFAG